MSLWKIEFLFLLLLFHFIWWLYYHLLLCSRKCTHIASAQANQKMSYNLRAILHLFASNKSIRTILLLVWHSLSECNLLTVVNCLRQDAPQTGILFNQPMSICHGKTSNFSGKEFQSIISSRCTTFCTTLSLSSSFSFCRQSNASQLGIESVFGWYTLFDCCTAAVLFVWHFSFRIRNMPFRLSRCVVCHFAVIVVVVLCSITYACRCFPSLCVCVCTAIPISCLSCMNVWHRNGFYESFL